MTKVRQPVDIKEMKKRKKELGYTNVTLAEASGVPLGTVQRILSGETKNPGYEAWSALVRTLFRNEAEDAGIPQTAYGEHHYGRPHSEAMYVKEAEVAYGKRQGEFTVDDYYSMPDDVRVEIIDGVIYDMTPAPTIRHQDIAGNIYAELLMKVRTDNGRCHPFIAPVDVQLDRDNSTMVQPDVAMVCAEDIQVKGRVIYGAPDFVVEVLSPSTKKKDLTIKYRKYLEAGVREYWIIDPDSEQVITYYFEEDMLPVIYGFKDKVPVRIWDEDRFFIDFNGIAEFLDR